MFLSLFLDKEGRNALARRAQIQQLESDLKIEMAKTNALIKAMNRQGEQKLGISEGRQAEIAVAMQSQAKAQEALNELDPETRKRMIERVLADEQARLPQSKEVVPTQLVQGPGDEDDDDIREEGRQI